MKRKVIEILALVSLFSCFTIKASNIRYIEKNEQKEQIIETKTIEKYNIITHASLDLEQEEIRNEIFYGELETLAILVYAEAGNQDELGQRYVADCVLNRVDDKDFPDNVEDVIYQMDPVQFATTVNGAMGKAGYDVKEETFNLVLEEYESRKDTGIIYFRTDRYSDSGHPAFKYGDHYFSTK